MLEILALTRDGRGGMILVDTNVLLDEAVPRESLFLAGKAFLRYRQGGAKRNVLPDFIIGAHSAVVSWPLLTRDARRYRTYFPTVDIIAS
jgi:hypothetical protein